VLNEKWQEKGIVFINDAMKTNGNLSNCSMLDPVTDKSLALF
jgi:hypothetical protein